MSKKPLHYSYGDVRAACRKWLKDRNLLEPWECRMDNPQDETLESKERRRKMFNPQFTKKR